MEENNISEKDEKIKKRDSSIDLIKKMRKSKKEIPQLI